MDILQIINILNQLFLIGKKKKKIPPKMTIQTKILKNNEKIERFFD